MDFIPDASVDLICTHPPYANIIHYSEDMDVPEDLPNFNVPEFLEQMKSVAAESFRVLKKGKFCAILMGTHVKKGM